MISVVIPAYNAALFLSEAIQSMLDQTFRDFELLVLDDGSTDSTRAIAEEFAGKDRRVRVISHKNVGLANNLNMGLESSRFEWVALLHADDVAMPNRLERQWAFLQQYPNLAAASCWVLNIDERGRVIGKGRPPWTSLEVVEEAFNRGELIGFHHSPVVLRREIILRAGGYRQEFVPSEDIDLWNRLLYQGHKVLVQPEFLIKYRIHGQAASVAKAKLIRQKARWVKVCVQRRRLNQAEPCWEEFLKELELRPWPQRLNEERKDMAKILYKNAVQAYASRNYLGVPLPLLGGALLQPGFVLREALDKYVWTKTGHDS